MKIGHFLALSARGLAILDEMATARQDGANRDNADVFLFPGGKPGKPLNNMALLMTLRRMGRGELTTHGFRSSFRDWAAERTSFPSEVVEMALAHAVAGKVEAAYRRSDLFEKRRRLADAWAAHCANGKSTGEVVSIRQARS